MKKFLLLPLLFTLFIGVGCQNTQVLDVNLLKMKESCRTQGEKVRGEWIVQYHEETFSDNPQYTYNQKLNTCLWADSYTDSNVSAGAVLDYKYKEDKFVLDVPANKVLLEYTSHDGKQIGDISESKYEDEKTKLFNQ